MDDLLRASVTEIAEMIRAKTVSSVEAATAHIDRIKMVNPILNAVVQLSEDRALAEAAERDAELARGDIRGPLHGVPFTLKDSHDTEGIISTGGTLGRAKHVPAADSPPAARLRAAGGVLLGKTNTPELTFAGNTDNKIYGRTNNPYDISRTPGGSSGGAASIIAAGGSPLDLGSDTGGSIREPASHCGIAGLKPTSGRVPRTGHIVPPGGAWDSFTTIGPLARRVEDLWLIFPLITGTDWRDPYVVNMPLTDPGQVSLSELRVAFYPDNGLRTPTKEITDAVRAASQVLGDAGATVVEHAPPALGRADEILDTHRGADGGARTRMLLSRYGTTESPLLHSNSQNRLDVEGFAHLQANVDGLRTEMLRFMEGYDAILCPVSARPAPLHEDAQAFMKGGYNHVYNITGWPAVSVRAGSSSEGLPIGVQIVARPWREDVALALALVIEQATGGWTPPAI
ncbi:MAG TPA: amidase [Dehalococcoidia bacterium]|jgi:amidase|nr:amidase [Dehalococcoidia bacterium]